MSGYLTSKKITNVKGRMEYITDKNRQENIVDYYNTTNNEFWKLLAKESRERHKVVKAGGKCCEARELIIGIPEKSKITAKELCDIFKNKYNVECACAIHYNIKNEMPNKHCHLIFSERKKLETPEIIEEKRAVRNYYYDAKGKKVKKADAVKVVKKGQIVQKGETRYFSDKNEYFKTEKFVIDCKELFLKDTLKIDWSLKADKQNKELSEQHIGKNNPKAEFIRKNNKLKQIVKNVCNAGDFIMNKESGYTLKQFKEIYEIKSFKTPCFEENKDKVFDLVEKMQLIYNDEVKKEVKEHNSINDDVYFLEKTNPDCDTIQNKILDNYEPKTHIKSKPKLLEYLKNKLFDILERLEKLIKIQKFIYIEPENQISITQDSKDNMITIKNDNYFKEQEQKYLEYNNDYEDEDEDYEDYEY